jgi:Domain of unknown function (DUF1929)
MSRKRNGRLVPLAAVLSMVATLGPVPAAGAAVAAAPSEDERLRQYQEALLDPWAPQPGWQPPQHAAHDHSRHMAAEAARAAAAAEPGPLAPAVGGQWSWMSALGGNEPNPTHIVAGPGGKLLLVEGSGNRAARFSAGTFRTFIIDNKGTREIPTPADVFCSGHVLSPDGRYAILLGGTTGYGPFKGLRDIWAVDFVTEKYVKKAPMAFGRWYPSDPKTEVGKIAAIGGLDEKGLNTKTHELYDPKTNKVTKLPGTRTFPLYPQVVLMSGGVYFFNGAGSGARPAGSVPGIWNIKTNSFKAVPGMPAVNQRAAATSCYFGDVRQWQHMTMGGQGNGAATNSVAVVDLDASASPKFKAGPALPKPTVYANCVNLPDGTLLLVGGGSKNTIANAHSDTLLLRSVNGPWITMNPLPAGEHRVYHSMAALQRNGCVRSVSSNPTDGAWSTSNLEYCPPYIFKAGGRPVVVTGTGGTVGTVHYGKWYNFKATTSDGAKITRVTITTLPTVTHAADVNQRYAPMSIKVAASGTSGQFYVSNWPSAYPPGRYWIWLWDAKGRVSLGHEVMLS